MSLLDPELGFAVEGLGRFESPSSPSRELVCVLGEDDRSLSLSSQGSCGQGCQMTREAKNPIARSPSVDHGYPSLVFVKQFGSPAARLVLYSENHSVLLTRTSVATKTRNDCGRLPWCTTAINAENSIGRDCHHPIISPSGIPSAVIVFRILHPILASTRCDTCPLARIAGPTMAL